MAYPFARWLVIPLLRQRITHTTGAANLPQSLPFIVVANHSSWLDSAYLVAVLSAVTDKKIFIIASSHKYGWLGGLPIDPQQPDTVLTTAAKKLSEGHPVVVFPEGNSNPTPTLRPGKTGAARLALQTHAPIVPVGIRGTHQPNFIMSLINFFSWQRPITIVIGAPIAPSPATTAADLTHDIMAAISTLSGKPLFHA